jgi:hypothetical protein
MVWTMYVVVLATNNANHLASVTGQATILCSQSGSGVVITGKIRNNITCTIYCNRKTAATLDTLETWFVSSK